MNKQTPIDRWRSDYDKEPLNAIHRLLTRKVYMGALNRNEPDEIIFRLFHSQSNAVLSTLDSVVKEWLETYITNPESISASRWANTLIFAFSSVNRLNLSSSFKWLTDTYEQNKSYIRALYQGPARDPEGELLRTFAQRQTNQQLLYLWMQICEMKEELPWHYVSIGITGLRQLPDENGDRPGDIPSSTFSGFVKMAEALYTQGGSHALKQARELWLMELKAFFAMYTRTQQYWITNFFPLIDQQKDSIAAKWLMKVLPGLHKHLKGKRRLNKMCHLEPPSYGEYKSILRLIEKQAVKQITPQIKDFLHKHGLYARQTGDAEYYVKNLNSIANRIYKQDADFALSLVEEAFVWQPYSSYVWSIRSKIEAFKGNVQKAIDLLWKAKRKFPENPIIRTQLANLMQHQGELETASLIYQQTMIDFPNNVVCRTGLAEVLKKKELFQEAEDIYRQTMSDFPENAVCRNGLAEVLRKMGRLQEAEELYRQTMSAFPHNVICRTGLAMILFQQHNPEESRRLLTETLQEFPQNKVAHEFMEKVFQNKNDIDIELFETEDLDETEDHNSITEEFETPNNLSDQYEFTDKQKDATLTSDDIDVTTNLHNIEAKIGMINLFRLANKRVDGAKKDEYNQKILSGFENLFEKTQPNIPAFIEKGWWLADETPEKAVDFYNSTIQNHPNVLGFHLGLFRSQHITGINQNDNGHWETLINQFPARKTIIKLEQSLHYLESQSETDETPLEDLRSQVKRDIKNIPAAIQPNEKWVRDFVQKELFENLSIDNIVTQNSMPQIRKNFQKHKNTLKGIVEQSVEAV